MQKIDRMEHLPVETPEGLISLDVHRIVWNPDEMDMRTNLLVWLQGEELLLETENTEEALLKLARKLPAGWRIRSCLSCRHGHFCPVGDYDNELFCVTDFDPEGKSELVSAIVDHDERAKRSRGLFDLCDAYAPQTKDYFTYSDYRLVVGERDEL